MFMGQRRIGAFCFQEFIVQNISIARRQKAFDEGRRSAKVASARNPYENTKLRDLWERGRAHEQAGTLTTPIPPLAHGRHEPLNPSDLHHRKGRNQVPRATRSAQALDAAHSRADRFWLGI